MIILALFGKFGALFSTIPQPVIGGVFCCMFGMIAAVGISNLQYVDLNSVRNLFIIGFSFILGLAVPKYLNENSNAIKTGKYTLKRRNKKHGKCTPGIFFILESLIALFWHCELTILVHNPLEK